MQPNPFDTSDSDHSSLNRSQLYEEEIKRREKEMRNLENSRDYFVRKKKPQQRSVNSEKSTHSTSKSSVLSEETQSTQSSMNSRDFSNQGLMQNFHYTNQNNMGNLMHSASHGIYPGFANQFQYNQYMYQVQLQNMQMLRMMHNQEMMYQFGGVGAPRQHPNEEQRAQNEQEMSRFKKKIIEKKKKQKNKYNEETLEVGKKGDEAQEQSKEEAKETGKEKNKTEGEITDKNPNFPQKSTPKTPFIATEHQIASEEKKHKYYFGQPDWHPQGHQLTPAQLGQTPRPFLASRKPNKVESYYWKFCFDLNEFSKPSAPLIFRKSPPQARISGQGRVADFKVQRSADSATEADHQLRQVRYEHRAQAQVPSQN